MMAIDAGVPVVPISVSGATQIMPKAEVRIFPSTVRLTIHEPIATNGYSKENVAELMQRTQKKILSALSVDELPKTIPGTVETRAEQPV